MSLVGFAAVLAMLATQAPVVLSIKLEDGSSRCAADSGPAVGKGSAAGVSHRGAAIPPALTAALVVDRTTYATGDPITFTVILTNASTAPLSIPVLPTRAVCSQMQDEGVQRAELQLRARSPAGKPALIAVAALWSVPSRPESRFVLQPGQSVRIDVSRTWDPLHAPNGLADRVSLFARVEGVSAQATESSNEIVVQVTR